MTDKLIEWVSSVMEHSIDDVCAAIETRILADAKIIKAAEELADAVSRESDNFGIPAYMEDALATYRAAVSERDT